MAEIGRFRRDDRRAVDALYRRVFGADAADAQNLRWSWEFVHNPNAPSDGPMIWVAREGPAIVGQCAAIPVRLAVAGHEAVGGWGTDVMVAPERQRQGLGEQLLRMWDRNVGVALGLNPSESSYQLFRKLGWPDIGTVPCLVKPLTRRAVRLPRWPVPVNRLLSAVTWPFVLVIGRTRPLRSHTRIVHRFDEAATELWQRVASKFDLAVRRDTAYLNWRYATTPHVRYSAVLLEREERLDGWAVFRHVHEPLGRVTLLVDLLADPADEEGVAALLRRVDREARAADSDKIRTFMLHAAFRKVLKRSGYFQVKSWLRLIAKVNVVQVPAAFYKHVDRWHITLGDSDVDRGTFELEFDEF
ncbi:MAG TPA: GNAT family N-acetyltransferase [Vicinamibacterales bacterium]|nr:GNAT family N-acetyltransferase [Vicinamibacterales bacterium]